MTSLNVSFMDFRVFSPSVKRFLQHTKNKVKIISILSPENGEGFCQTDVFLLNNPKYINL